MTGDEFTAKYRLRAQLNDGDIVSYRAADARGGYALVHVFRGEDALEFDEASLGAEGRRELREVLEVEGIRVVVTEVVEAFSTFEAWYGARQGPPEREEGAFTRIFRVQPEREDQPGPDAPAEALPTPPDADLASPRADAIAPPPPSRPPLEEPGEFTRLFGAMGQPPVRPVEPAPSPEPPPQAPPPAPPTAGSGDPTLVRPAPKRPEEPAAPPSGAPPSDGPGTGTFTRIMRGLQTNPEPPRPPEQPPAQPPRPPQASPPPRPGGWQPVVPPPLPGAHRPVEPPPLPGYAPQPAPPPPPLTPPPPPPSDPGAAGPYTLAMRAYRGPGEPTPPPTPSESGAGGYGMEGYGGQGGSYLDRLQEKEDAAATRPPGGMAKPPLPPPPPSVPSVPSGPSDYTRVIRGAGPPPMGARPGGDVPSPYGGPPLPVPTAAPAPRPAPTPSKTPLVIALVVTLAVIVALILFFALRGGGGAGAAG